MSVEDDLPEIDTHSLAIAAEPQDVWEALEDFLDRAVSADHRVLAWALGTVPPSGFAVVSQAPGARVVLGGRHRFSRYRLTFTIERRPEDDHTLLHATTHAAFPGVLGRGYRMIVIRGGLHAVATNRLLRSVSRRLRFP